MPIAVIFGANASGKSNIQEAFRYMELMPVRSFAFGGEGSREKENSDFIEPTPFLLDEDSKNAESSFEVYFIDSEGKDAKSYNYGFSINKNGITEEWLNHRSKSSRGDYKRIFYSDKDELDLSDKPRKYQHCARKRNVNRFIRRKIKDCQIKIHSRLVHQE